MIDLSLQTPDLIVLAGYFLVIIVIGYLVARKTDTGEDLFLAGRSLGWIAIGFSLFASNISSTTLIGLTGQAYVTGISVSNYEWMATIILVFMAFFFIPFFLKSQVTTIPEYLERRFDARSRKYFSVVTIFLSIVVDGAGGLYAGSLVLQSFFPQFQLWQICIAFAVFAGLYTAFGGLKAVVYTDVLQAVVLLFGTSAITYLLFQRFDFSWSQATAELPSGHLSVIRPIDDPALPWLGTLIGVPILGFYYWSTNQYIVQRVLGAKNLKHARWGAMLGGLLKLPVLFIMVIPGVLALKLFPGLPESDMVFPTLVTHILPVGMTGLVLAGLIAAIMSSVDSQLNSSSTLIVMDFIKAKNPNIDAKTTGKYGRTATFVLMAVAAVWAPMIQYFPGMFHYIQEAFSYIVPPVAAIFLFGTFWSRGNKEGAYYTLIIGHSLSALVFILSKLGVVNVHFTIVAGLLTFLCMGIFVGVSLQFPAPDRSQIDGITWSGRMAEVKESLPWYKNFKMHSAVLLALTAMLVIAFW